MNKEIEEYINAVLNLREIQKTVDKLEPIRKEIFDIFKFYFKFYRYDKMGYIFSKYSEFLIWGDKFIFTEDKYDHYDPDDTVEDAIEVPINFFINFEGFKSAEELKLKRKEIEQARKIIKKYPEEFDFQ